MKKGDIVKFKSNKQLKDKYKKKKYEVIKVLAESKEIILIEVSKHKEMSMVYDLFEKVW